MQEDKRIIREEQTATRQDGTVVNEQRESVETKADGKTTAANVIWYLWGLISIILGIRFILKLTGANPTNDFVNFIYSVSGVLSAPFDSIFGVTKAETGTVDSVFEPSILVAIAVYGLIAWGIAKLLTLNESNKTI